MLMNNLDPEVAEHPEDLVVYGGTGRAARSWAAFDAIVRDAARPRGRRDAAGPVRQAGRRVPHPRLGAARVDRQLQSRWRLGELGEVPRAGGRGPDDVRADDRGLVDLHRHAGDPAGHIRDVRRRRQEGGFGGARCAGTITLTGGRRRHGRRAAARGDHERRRGDLRGLRREPHRPAHRAPLPRHQGRRHRRRAARWRSRRETRGGRCRSACSATPPRSFPSCCARDAPIDIVTDQTSAHDPLAYLPIGVDVRRHEEDGRQGPGVLHRAGREQSMAKHVEAMVGFMDTRRRGVRLRQLDPRRGPQGRLRQGLRLPRLRSRLHPAAVLGGARARSAGRRCPATRRTSTPPTARSWSCSPTTSTCAAGSRWPASEVAFQGLPARICWLGYGERHRAGSEVQRDGGLRRAVGADRDRPRPPRLRLGRLAVPGDRGDADGSDAIADWPLLNALVNTASGASWVSIHHGGGVGMGRSIHAGPGDAWPTARRWPAQKLERVLTNDPGMGVIRHVDAGYEHADRRSPPSAASVSRCGRVNDMRRSTRCGPTILDVGRAPRHRRLPPVRLDRRRPDAARVVHRLQAASARHDRRGGPQRQPVGVVDAAGWTATRRTRSSPDRTWTRCPTAARSTARSAWCRAFAAVDLVRAARRRARAPARRSSRSPRRRARGSAWPASGSRLSHRRADAPTAPAGCATPTASTLAEALRGGGSRPEQLGADATLADRVGVFVELHVEQGRALVDLRPPGRRRVVDLAARPMAVRRSAARPTTPAPPGWPTGGTRCCRSRPRCIAARAEARPRTTRSRRSARSRRARTAPTRSRRACTRGWTPAPPTRRRCGRWSSDPPQRGARRGDGAQSGVDAESVTADRRRSPRRRACGCSGAGRSATSRCCRPAPGHDAGILSRQRADRDAVRPQPHRGVALARGVRRGRGLPGRRRRRWPTSWRSWVRRDGEYVWCERRLARAGDVADGVLFSGRRRPDHRDRADAEPRCRGVAQAARPGAARAGERPLARLPPGAARADPARSRQLLDVARADVRGAADRLDPERYRALARAVYAEMALAGITARRRVPLPAPRCRRQPATPTRTRWARR